MFLCQKMFKKIILLLNALFYGASIYDNGMESLLKNLEKVE